MRGDLETFRRGALFALCSIRQPVITVPDQLAEIDAERASASCLWGWKRRAYAHLQLEGARLRDTVCDLSMGQVDQALLAFLEVPGLGIVKAGFACQLLGFDIACIDGRNAAREGRNRDAYKFTKAKLSRAGWARHVSRYIDDVGGRAEEYWDGWCAHVAPDYGLSAEALSALHLAIIPEDFVPF